MAAAIEQLVDLIFRCIGAAKEKGAAEVEATAPAQESWMSYVADLASASLFAGSWSWYSGANIDGKPQVFTPYVGGLGRYVRECEEIASIGFEGFQFGMGERDASRGEASRPAPRTVPAHGAPDHVR